MLVVDHARLVGGWYAFYYTQEIQPCATFDRSCAHEEHIIWNCEALVLMCTYVHLG